MTDSIRSFVSALGKAGSVLVVAHEQLPLPLAVWIPAIVGLLQSNGKKVTVMVADEPKGWGSRVDAVYPRDMVLQLESLKQVIRIPFGGENVGDISYGVNEGSLEIAITPEEKPLELNRLKTETSGNIYDVVLLVGVTSRHATVQNLAAAKSSLTKSAIYSIGSVAQKQTLQQVLPFVPSVTVLEGLSYESLSGITHALYNQRSADTDVKELLTLFFYAMQKRFPGVMPANAYELMQLVTATEVNEEKLASVVSPDNTKTNTLVTRFTNNATFDASQHLVVYKMFQSEYRSLGATELDALLATFFLPEFAGMETRLVFIERSPKEFVVTVQGTSEQVKQIALKYGFAFTEEGAEGVVTDIGIEKLQADMIRVVGAQLPAPKDENEDVDVDVDVDESEVDSGEDVDAPVQKAPSVPVSPSLDDVLRNAPPAQEQKTAVEQTDIPEETPETAAPKPPAPPPQIPGQQPPPKTSKGIDFAAIAQKMRESN